MDNFIIVDYSEITISHTKQKEPHVKFRTHPIDPFTKTYLPFGNGCYRHSNCFECPEPDCIYTDAQEHIHRGHVNAA